jgi:hypothetical protein
MEDALQEMVGWANKNPAPEDLVILAVSDCVGVNCSAMVSYAGDSFGI